MFRTLVGKPRVPGTMAETSFSNAYVGAQALCKRGLLNTVERMIQDWDEKRRRGTMTFTIK